MGFFTSPAEQRDWATDLQDSGIIPTLRGSYTGIGALKNSDVLTAVSIVAGDIARFPVIFTDRATDAVVDIESLDYLLNTKTNQRLSAYQWKFSMMVNAILTGNAYSRIIRDPYTGEPSEFEFFAPSQVDVDVSDPANVIYRMYPQNGKMYQLAPEDVIHVKFFSYDTVLGRSPLLSLRDEMELQNSGVSTLQKFFNSGFQGSLLKITGRLSGEARKKAREAFEKSQEGTTAGSPIIMDSTMEYTPLQVDTNVLNLISSNNYSTAQIAKALRVPAYRLAQNSPNQSVKQLSDDYILNDLPFYMEPIKAEFALKLLDDESRHTTLLDFDTRKVTGMPIGDANTAVNNGIFTGNEGRAAVGKKPLPIPEMDTIQSSLNSVDITQKAAYQAKNATTKGGET